jgi:hypothetical protein
MKALPMPVGLEPFILGVFGASVFEALEYSGLVTKIRNFFVVSD